MSLSPAGEACPGCPSALTRADSYSHEYAADGITVVAYWHISCYLANGLPIGGPARRGPPGPEP